MSLFVHVTQRALELAAGAAVLGIGIGLLRQSLLLAGCFAVMAVGLLAVRTTPPLRGDRL